MCHLTDQIDLGTMFWTYAACVAIASIFDRRFLRDALTFKVLPTWQFLRYSRYGVVAIVTIIFLLVLPALLFMTWACRPN